MDIPCSPAQIRAMSTGVVAVWVFLLGAAPASAQGVTVRLYDYSGLTADETERLAKITALPFLHGGITVSWIHCRGALAGRAPVACSGNLTANEVLVRLQPTFPETSNARSERLGVAFVTPQGGQYATVYVPAVRALAAERAIALDLALGYAVAHEIGHCLLGPGHSLAGLMRAIWTRDDTQAMARLSFGLSKPEALRAAAQLNSVGARSSSLTRTVLPGALR